LKIQAYLFDWGDTLMRDDKRYKGSMCTWPEVFAVEGAVETLRALSIRARCCLATNARDSSEKDIRRALARVGLDRYIETVFCFQRLGVAKPDPVFFEKVGEQLGLPPQAIAMVGDSYDTDIVGALQAGLQAFWYNPQNAGAVADGNVVTIHALQELIEAFRGSGKVESS
jgi:putative hydrolase of the HAD superfamily